MADLRVGDRVKVQRIVADAEQDKSLIAGLILERLGGIGIITRLNKSSQQRYCVDFGGGDEDEFDGCELVPVGNREWQAVIEAEQEQGVEREY